MKRIVYMLFFLVSSTLILGACTNQEVGTAIGGGAGAGIGYAVSDSAAGAVVGGAAGALIGNQIGRNADLEENSYYYY